MKHTVRITRATRWRRAIGALLLLGGLGGAHPQASAQVPLVYAQTPDFPLAGGGAVNVANTGADEIPLAGKFFRVMCWDGDKPSLGWSLDAYNAPGQTGLVPLLGTRYGRVTDPDVVADVTQRRGKGTQVLVTYLLDGTASYEVWKYDAGTNQMQPVTPAPVPLAKAADNPNVDVNVNGVAVITYACKGAIFGHVYDMPSQQLWGASLVAADPAYKLSQPDVALVTENSDYPNVSFIYRATDGKGRQSVRMVQVSSMQLRSATSVSQGVGTDVLPFNKGGFDAPRICAPVEYPYFGPCDYQAIVAETGTNRIIGLNHTTYFGAPPATVSPGNLPVATVLNANGRLDQQATCSKPVVSFCGDAIEAVWTLEDGTLFGSPAPPVVQGDDEVVRIELNWNGNIFRGDYALVNDQLPGNQFVPSVAGRFSAFLGGALGNGGDRLALYCFFSESDQEIYFKASDYDAISVRPAAGPAAGSAAGGAPQLVAAPNPFRDETLLTLSLGTKERVQALTIYDSTGRLVQALDAAEAGAAGQLRWQAAGLPAGLSPARLRTSTGATYTYRLHHE